MIDKLQQIQARLNDAPAILANKKVAAGFDGFIDSIVKVVNYKSADEGTVHFSTIAQFGNYISSKSGSGFSLESEEIVQKLGGNMPIMSNALGQMGCAVNCVGAFGVPGIAAAFAAMHQNCMLHSFTNPGFTNAMEFTDGKIMLAQMTDLNNADWDTIKAAIGLDKLREIFLSADLTCLVNWSELDHSNNIWQGLLDDVYAGTDITTERQFFFDLSDCSKRSDEAIQSAIMLIQRFGKFGKTTLSLNKNEAGILYNTLVGSGKTTDLNIIGNSLFWNLGIDVIVIHSSQTSLAWDANGTYRDDPAFIASPKIFTGAGDNFNAGFCLAQLLGLDTSLSLMMANVTANCYINSGQSPDIAALQLYISQL